MFRRSLAFAIAALVSVPTVSADVILEDTFSYADGDLVGNGGWTAHSGAGAAPIQVAGGAASLGHGANSREDAHVSFTGIDSGLVTYAFDLIVNDDAPITGTDFEYFAHFATGSGTLSNFVGRLDIVAPTGGGDYTLGIATFSSTADATLSTDFNYGDTVSVLVGYDIDTDTASLTVGGETIMGAAGTANLTIESFGLRQSNSSSDEAIIVDNLVLSSFTAVPEPTSAGVLGLIALGGCLIRRRK